MSDTIRPEANDAMAQIARLREQVEALVREKAMPAMESMSACAGATAHEAAEWSRQRADTMRETVRGQPLAAILIAAAVGFVLGRLAR